MRYSLRNYSDETMLDVELYVTSNHTSSERVELQIDINIGNYSRFLLDRVNNSKSIICAFDKLLNLNDWMINVYFKDVDNDGTHENQIGSIVELMLKNTSEMFGLKYVAES